MTDYINYQVNSSGFELNSETIPRRVQENRMHGLMR